MTSVERRSTTPYLLLWTAFVVHSAAGMAYEPLLERSIASLGPIEVAISDILLVAALSLGIRPLLWLAGESQPHARRLMSRLIIGYLLFEVLLVIPVALWSDAAELPAIVRTMGVRFIWLLFPIVVVISRDGRARRLAAIVPVVAATCVVTYGAYLAATGGGTYYIQDGEVRYRVLAGSAALLTGWPFVVAASGAASRRISPPLLAVGLAGMALTNHRTGFIAFAVAGLVCVLLSGQARRVLPYALPAALLAGVALLAWGSELKAVFGFTTGRIVDLTTTTGSDRMMRWRYAWEFFLAHPVNDWVWSWRWYLVDLNRSGPHNAFLEVAVTEGLAGLLFYGAILSTAFKRAWRFVRSDSVARALAGYLVLYLLFSLGNGTWYLIPTMPLLVGAVAALAARADQLNDGDRRILA